MSRREEWLRNEIPKFIKAYARKKGPYDPNDRDFDQHVLEIIQRMPAEELSKYMSGDDDEQVLNRILSDRRRLDAPSQWLKQRKRIQFSSIRVSSISAEGIEYLDEQGNRSFIDFQECRHNLAKNLEVLVRMYKKPASTWHREYVGLGTWRAKHPYIEFFTTPPTRFEFAGSKREQAELENFRLKLFELGAPIA